MKKTLIALALTAGTAFGAFAQDIVDVAAKAGNFNTLVTAVKAAGLVDTLKGPGPFTVFAPTDAAFAKVPKADLDALLKDKAKLTAVLTYHVVPGKVDAATLTAQIAAGNGKATLKTVQGGTLTASLDGGRVLLTDARNGRAHVTAADLAGGNGVVHVIDSVLLP